MLPPFILPIEFGLSYVAVVIDSAASKKFIDGNIQKLLKQLTGLNLDKVFRARALGQRQSPPVYKFMTTEQIQEVIFKL